MFVLSFDDQEGVSFEEEGVFFSDLLGIVEYGLKIVLLVVDELNGPFVAQCIQLELPGIDLHDQLMCYFAVEPKMSHKNG